MNEIITRLLDWCDEHDYDVYVDTHLLKGVPFLCVNVTLTRNGYSVRHIFNLDRFCESKNLYPSTKWFDNGLDFELRSFLEFAEDQFSIHEAEDKNDGKV